ncbi:MAG: HNH endonuclease [Bdellovibrionales bacterium]
MEPSNFSDEELFASLEERFAIERDNSHHILLHLKEIQSRRLFAKRGFSNMFSMLIKHFRQSETSANQHLKALDLMLAVPVVEERLVSGDLNLSTLAMAQRQIKREEKLTGKKIAQAKKSEIIESITNKTMAQTETELFKLLPGTASNPANSERRISEDATRMNLTVPDDVREMMIRLKDLWAHVDPTMDNVEVMRRAFKLALTRVDPTEKKKTQGATESVKHRGNDRLKYYGKEYDRALWERAGSRCEFVDNKTGRRCDCKFGLQKEHVIPLGKGGTNELSNMQLLCAPHNQLRARQAYGDRKINRHQAI